MENTLLSRRHMYMFLNMHFEALISLKISTRKGWKTCTLVYTWNHTEIYWCFFRCRLSFVCLISFRHVLYLCTRIMVYNQREILCAFRENWNELQYSLHHMEQSSRKQRTWERMAPKPCSHSVKTYSEENEFPTAEQVQ